MKLTNKQIKEIKEAIANGGDITLSFPKPNPDKWFPPKGKFWFNQLTYSKSYSDSNHISLIGRERNTEEETEIALAGHKRRNLLSAWAAANGGEQVFIIGNDNWYIYFDFSINSCLYSKTDCIYNFEKVYMTKEAAEKFCEYYKEGRIKL